MTIGTEPGEAGHCGREGKEYDRLKARIKVTQKSIQGMGFNVMAENFREWERLSEYAQQKAEGELIDGVLSILFTGFKEDIRAYGSFNPPKANASIRLPEVIASQSLANSRQE